MFKPKAIYFEKNIEKVYFFKCITNSHVLG